MTISQRAVEAALDAFNACKSSNDLDAMESALAAALAVDGLCLVPAIQPWPPFNVEDRVTHTGRQEDGTVTAIDDGCVVVEFDKPTSSGRKSVGKYDANWFRMYPRGLLSAANDGEKR